MHWIALTHRIRRVLPLALYGAAGVCLLLALLLSRPPAIRKELVLIHDVSQSITAGGQRPPSVDLTPLRESADVVIHMQCADGSRLGTTRGGLGTGETDLASGIALAARLPVTGRVRRRAVLLSDGRCTRGDAVGMARTMRERLLLETIPHGSRPERDARIREAVAPPVLRIGERARIRAWVEAVPASEVMLRLEDETATVLEERRIRAAPHGGWEEFSAQPQTPGLHRWRLRVEMPGDEVPENDAVMVPVLVRGGQEILWVGGIPPTLEGFSIRRVDPGILQPGHLKTAAVVVLDNVPVAALPAAAPTVLGDAVRRGVGLLVLGGETGLGSGGYHLRDEKGVALEDLLPVRVIPEEDLAVVFVLDTSGSMQEVERQPGMRPRSHLEIAVEALLAAADTLVRGDELAVVTYTRTPTTLLPRTRLEEPEETRTTLGAQLRTLQAYGGTSIPAALRAALQELDASRARRQHILLLCDGDTFEEGAELEASIGEIASALETRGIGLSIYVTEDDFDPDFLHAITNPPGRVRVVENEMLVLPQILRRDMEAEREPQRGTGARLSFRDTHPAVPAAVPETVGAHNVLGSLRTERPGSRVLLGDEDGLIHYAVGSLGMGRVAVLSGHPAREWTWEADALLRAALTWAAGTGDAGGIMQGRWEAEGLHVDFQPRAEGVSGMRLIVKDVDHGALVPVAPGVWSIHVPDPGMGLLGLSVVSGEGEILAEQPLWVESRAEWLDFGPDGARLSRIARAGGGSVVMGAEGFAPWEAAPLLDDEAAQRVPASLLVAGLALFLLGLLAGALR